LFGVGLVGPLALLGGATPRARQRGLDQFFGAAPPCNDDPLTKAVDAGPGYRPGAPLRRSLVDRDTAGAPLVLTGYVIGVRCGRIAGAELDFWQPDSRGAIDAAGSRLRGRQRTDAQGRYRVETIVPGAPAGRAPFIGARVQPPKGAALTTRLFLPDQGANAKDPAFAASLTIKPGPAGSFTFDFILDL
jgi:protocatechuate 3,4-dioxygenase beta subunit